ncbi:MAG: PorP/SprF family type IX secretion system membrane protein [Muribaculaceae bacterium]|nr:PorP/SprF family type IX secretion system membrane protein [Muribaculaceae bacterium]
MTIKLHDIACLLAAMTLTVVVALGAMAQSDAAFSHSWVGKSYYNPAAAGELNAIHMTLGSRMQWVDFKHAPMNFYLTVDAPYKLMGQRLGLGVKAEYERIGLYTNTRIGAQVAYKRKLGKNMMLSVGIQPGVFSQTFRGKEVIMPEDDAHQGNDEAIPKQDVSGTAFDANVGVFFSHPRYWAGFAVTHVTDPGIELKVSRESIDYYEFNVSRGYYFMGGGNIPIRNTLFEIQPSGMFALTQNVWTAQLATMVRYNRMLNIGVGYRWKDAVTAFIGVNLKDAYIGYAYDYPVSAISKATFGSHEVFITYNVKLENREKNKNKQKSIRLM